MRPTFWQEVQDEAVDVLQFYPNINRAGRWAIYCLSFLEICLVRAGRFLFTKRS